MLWPPLLTGTLVRRFKRFLIEVVLDPGRETVLAYCPNTGSMAGCCEPGRKVMLSRSPKTGRKLAYTWEMIDMGSTLVGVNTLRTNALVHEALVLGVIPSLAPYRELRPEVRTGPGCRIDFVLSGTGPPCYVEVKNCTMVEQGVAMFPDAVTARGRKHLVELMRLREEGCRSVLLFLVQRMDGVFFRPADRIDPEYGRILRQAHSRGVELLCYDTLLDHERIQLNRTLPVALQ